MKTKKIVISKPVIEETEKHAKWICSISGDFINTQLYYSVEKKWQDALAGDSLDAAVVALIPYIMYRSSEKEPINLV